LTSGGKAESYFLGEATYNLPWGAGYVWIGGCTKMTTRRVENSGGALDMDISAGQLGGCIQPYGIWYDIRPFTNRQSRVLINAAGFITWVTGTKGGVTEVEGKVYAGIAEGTVQVTSPNRQTVNVTRDRMAVGDVATGELTVEPLPTPWLLVNAQGAPYSAPSNRIDRKGQIYTVTNVAGQVKRYRVRRSPNYHFQIEEAN
jgi:hypothetical protein